MNKHQKMMVDAEACEQAEYLLRNLKEATSEDVLALAEAIQRARGDNEQHELVEEPPKALDKVLLGLAVVLLMVAVLGMVGGWIALIHTLRGLQ
jgi:hypothetical protein